MKVVIDGTNERTKSGRKNSILVGVETILTLKTSQGLFQQTVETGGGVMTTELRRFVCSWEDQMRADLQLESYYDTR